MIPARRRTPPGGGGAPGGLVSWAARRWPWLWLWGPPVVEMVVIFGLSSQSRVGPPAVMSDKLAHGLAYGLLGALLVRALAAGNWRRVTPRVVALAITMAAVYGALDEWHQSFVPRRTSELSDFVADVVGASVAAVTLWSCGIIRRSFGD